MEEKKSITTGCTPECKLLFGLQILSEFKEVFEEGRLYIISNFSVKPYINDSIRCIHCEKQLWLSYHTRVTPVPNDDGMIKQQEFDFTDIGDLQGLYKPEENYQLYDIIGVDRELRPLTRYTNQQKKEQRDLRFTLSDGRTSDPMFLIEEKISVTNEDKQVLSISNIRKLTVNNIENQVICQVTVNSVEDKQPWSYFACSTCQDEVEEDGDKYNYASRQQCLFYSNSL